VRGAVELGGAAVAAVMSGLRAEAAGSAAGFGVVVIHCRVSMEEC
jgi:hypothetical protein